jgi:hypothetical protein
MAAQKYNKLAGKHVLVIGGTSGKQACFFPPFHLKLIFTILQESDIPLQKPASNPQPA